MTEHTAADRLMALLDAALVQADACENTLVAALLAGCIAAVDGEQHREPLDTAR